MHPEPVVAGLIAAHDLDRPLRLSTSAGADLVDELKQLLPAFHRVVADFVWHRIIDCDNPAPLAQFDCYEDGTSPWGLRRGRLFTVRGSIGISCAVGVSEPGE